MEADKYEVLSFDCYGTLVDWESGIISGLRPVLRSHGVEATDEEILDLHARTEHGLQATSKKGAYLKYRDVLGSARSKDRTLMKEHKSLGKVIRRHSLLKERGKPTSRESTTILLLVPPTPETL